MCYNHVIIKYVTRFIVYATLRVKSFSDCPGRRPKLKDSEIVQMLIERDENGAEELRKKYEKYMEKVARDSLHDGRDAEECVNDALLAAWNSIPPQEPKDLRAYLSTLVKNIAISRVRRDNAVRRAPGNETLPLDELEDLIGDGQVEEAAEVNELSAAISRFLRERSESERNIFIRRYWFDDSIDQIARRFGAGESKIKMTLKRTRDRLRSFLKKEGFLR